MNAMIHLGLVHSVVRKMAHTTVVLSSGLSYDELVSAGSIGLLSAAARFNPALGFQFTTMAVPRIRGAVLDEIRMATGSRRQYHYSSVSIDAIDESDPSPRSMHDQLAAREADTQLSIEMEDMLRRLSKRERDILHRFYWAGETGAQIAASVGLTESRVSQIRARAIGRIREWYLSDSVAVDRPLVAFRPAGASPSMRPAYTCPRCNGPMARHHGMGRRPKSCDGCRTRAERRHVDYMRQFNQRVRDRKHAERQARLA